MLVFFGVAALFGCLLLGTSGCAFELLLDSLTCPMASCVSSGKRAG